MNSPATAPTHQMPSGTASLARRSSGTSLRALLVVFVLGVSVLLGLRVLFESEDGFRTFTTARLPSHATALAMTVHKSQGSEFSEVLLVLPEQPSPLLTRSLFYTGITRAKHQVEIWALAPRISEAVATRAERAAGLAERLAVEDGAANTSLIPAPSSATPRQLGLF